MKHPTHHYDALAADLTAARKLAGAALFAALALDDTKTGDVLQEIVGKLQDRLQGAERAAEAAFFWSAP